MVRSGGNIEAPATNVTAPHLQLMTFSTDQTVAPGTRFSLVLDGVPDRNVHVYAPGVTGYKPITVTIDPQPGVVLRTAEFPQAEIYHFKPLNEQVPVYQKPFRIIQDVMIDPSAQAQAALQGASSITIRGTVSYQACDDTVCFNPQTVPVTWTVALKSLDRERGLRHDRR
ncbi:MAG: protein-disulfide reductase DsbD domain-containing protein [Vicinamibacterales bacterium]